MPRSEYDDRSERRFSRRKLILQDGSNFEN